MRDRAATNVSSEAMSNIRYGRATGRACPTTALERPAPNGAPIDTHVLETAMLYGPMGGGAGGVMGAYLQAFYRRCDVVLTPSEFMRRRLLDWNVENIVVRPLGVDLKILAPSARAATLRRELGLGERTRLLVYAGRFTREKNLNVLLAAFRKLGRPYYLLLLGAGDPIPRQANVIVRRYERSSRELARVLASADGLVHAGDQESFGLVLLEAMACGRGVIAAAAGAAPELVTLETGMLAPARDAGALASTIQCFYQRDLDAMGRRARAHVERSYGWDTVMRGLLELFRTAQSWQLRQTARYAPS